jgi:hypothetical protein
VALAAVGAVLREVAVSLAHAAIRPGTDLGRLPGIPDLRSQISDLRFQIPDFRFEISDLRFEISDFRSEISDSRFQI